MEDLLDVDIAVPALGELLSEVFIGGIEICLKVSEAQVERLFSLIAQKGEEGRAELILALQAMAKVYALPIHILIPSLSDNCMYNAMPCLALLCRLRVWISL